MIEFRLGTALLAGSIVALTAGWASGADLGTVDAMSPLLPREEAKTLKNPVASTAASIAKGRLVYAANCVPCHGEDGKARGDAMGNATDLTDPVVWSHGTSEGEIFRSIRDGAGLAMRPFRFEIHQVEDLWHLVNYVHSLWPEDKRPPVVAN